MNLDDIKELQIGGKAVDELYINGKKAWQKPSSGFSVSIASDATYKYYNKISSIITLWDDGAEYAWWITDDLPTYRRVLPGDVVATNRTGSYTVKNNVSAGKGYIYYHFEGEAPSSHNIRNLDVSQQSIELTANVIIDQIRVEWD